MVKQPAAGPWTSGDIGVRTRIRGQSCSCATVHAELIGMKPNRDANARLIEKAWEMYDHLRWLVDRCLNRGHGRDLHSAEECDGFNTEDWHDFQPRGCRCGKFTGSEVAQDIIDYIKGKGV